MVPDQVNCVVLGKSLAFGEMMAIDVLGFIVSGFRFGFHCLCPEMIAPAIFGFGLSPVEYCARTQWH